MKTWFKSMMTKIVLWFLKTYAPDAVVAGVCKCTEKVKDKSWYILTIETAERVAEDAATIAKAMRDGNITDAEAKTLRDRLEEDVALLEQAIS